MEINGIMITNIKTYAKLKEIFKGKNPSPHTVLIFRVLIEGSICHDEVKILSDNIKHNFSRQKGGGFKHIYRVLK